MDSVISRLLQWAQIQPESPALITPAGPVSFAALLPRVRARAAWLHDSGVRAGDAVALAFGTEPMQQQVELFCALIWLGAPVLPLYPETPPAQQLALMRQVGARWLLSPQALPDCQLPWLPSSACDVALWADAQVPRGDAMERGFYFELTSGTTGIPKVMCLNAHEFSATRSNASAAYGWLRDDVAMAALPWPSKVGIRTVLRTLWAGMAYLDRPYPQTRAELAALVHDHGLSCLDGSPQQLRRLLSSRPLPDNAPVPLRLMTVVGAAIAPQDIAQARNTVVRNLHIGYGSTEMGIVATLHPQDAADIPYHPVPGLRAQALDPHGRPLPDGAIGRLRFAAAWLPTRYASGASDPVEGFHDGWFVSSDLGAVDASGGIHLQGRADNAINVGGHKVLPQDVEFALLSHAQVADAAVIGVADAQAGELVAAFLVLRTPLVVDVLRNYLLQRLPIAQVPVIYVGLETIPRNPEGKVLVEPLRAFYAARKREFDAAKARSG